MHFLIYTSTACHLMSDDELTALLGHCRERNLADDITGMLLYKDGSFMQALEGERDVIQQTYARIVQDTRHKDITLLRERALEARNFEGWSMGFKAVNSADLESEPGFSQFGEDTFSSAKFAAKPHIALRMLKTFHQNAR